MQTGVTNPLEALVLAFGVVVVVLAALYPELLAELLASITPIASKSEKSIKKESDAMLAQMDRNVAERKAKQR